MAKKKQLLIAMGCVIHQDAVLLIRRHEPDHPELHGNWELPGGKIDYGETPEEATEREILEETGIEVKALGMIPFPYSIIRREKGINPNIFCFQCQYIKGEIQSELPEKVSKVEWVSIPELNPHQIQSGSFLFINFLLKDLKTDVPNLFTEYKIEYIHLEKVKLEGSKATDKTGSIYIKANIKNNQVFVLQVRKGKKNRKQTLVIEEQFFSFEVLNRRLTEILRIRKQHGYFITEISDDFPRIPVLTEFPTQDRKSNQLKLF